MELETMSREEAMRTPAEKVEIYRAAAAMAEEWLPCSFIVAAVEAALENDEVYKLLLDWADADDVGDVAKQADTARDIQRILRADDDLGEYVSSIWRKGRL